jgi:hypothetical protein
LILLLIGCSSAEPTSSSNQRRKFNDSFYKKHQLFLSSLPQKMKT